MTRPVLPILIAALATAACTSRPTPPPAPPAAAPLEIPPRPAPAADGPVARLRLADALARAGRAHPALRVADARVEAARAAESGAGLLPEPTLEARVESLHPGGADDGRPDALLGASQEFPLGGRLDAERRVARADRERAERTRDAVAARIRAGLRGAFAAALHGEEVVRALEESERLLEEVVRISLARVAAGDATRDEPARAGMELAGRRSETAAARAHRDRARTALAAAMGTPGLRVEALEGSLDEALALPAMDDLSRRLAGSPGYAALRSQVAAARARADLAEAERIPDLRADLFYRRIGEPRGSALDAGLALEIPLFGRARSRAAAARAEAAAAEAEARRAMTEEEARARDAVARLEAAVEARRILDSEVLPRAEEVVALASTRHRAGDLSLVEFLTVRERQVEVRLARLDALREIAAAAAELAALVPPETP